MKLLRARDAQAAVAEMTKVLVRLQTKYMHQWSEQGGARSSQRPASSPSTSL